MVKMGNSRVNSNLGKMQVFFHLTPGNSDSELTPSGTARRRSNYHPK
jgi:hypothetical protein